LLFLLPSFPFSVLSPRFIHSSFHKQINEKCDKNNFSIIHNKKQSHRRERKKERARIFEEKKQEIRKKETRRKYAHKTNEEETRRQSKQYDTIKGKKIGKSTIHKSNSIIKTSYREELII
jgi:phenylalanyl-tRNA synthetase alpha subunit